MIKCPASEYPDNLGGFQIEERKATADGEAGAERRQSPKPSSTLVFSASGLGALGDSAVALI
jgi:hypothetical protein